MCCTVRSETPSPLLALETPPVTGAKSNLEYSKISLGNHVTPSVWYQTLALVSARSCATHGEFTDWRKRLTIPIDKQPLGKLFVKGGFMITRRGFLKAFSAATAGVQ